MKAINILRTLLSESVNTENCGIVKVYENMPYTEFIRQYLCHDFQDQVLDYHRCVAIEGEYFYCWHSTELNFCQLQARFGCNFCCSVHYIKGSYLHIIPITDEECEED